MGILSAPALEDLSHRPNRIRFRGGLVLPVALDAGEAEGHAGGVLRALLDVAEGYLHHQLGADVDGPAVGAEGDLLELPRLPDEPLVGQSLEGLAQHDEAAVVRIAGAAVGVREPALAPAVPPFGGEDHQVQGVGGLDRSEEHTSELQSRPHLVCRLLLEKKKSIYCYQYD